MGQLEETVEAILGLRQTIARYHENLKRNEIQTRASLIDPMLRVIGWDVSNPDEVVQETGRGAGVADYALKDRNTGMPLLLLESKSLNTDLGKAREQVAQYCYGEAVRSAIITDGDDWVLLDIDGDVFDDETDDAYDDEESHVTYNDIAQFSISRDDAVISAIIAQRFGNPLSSPGVSRSEIESAMGPRAETGVTTQPDSRPGADHRDVKTLASLKELNNPPVPSKLLFDDGFVFWIHTPAWYEAVRQIAIYVGEIYSNLTDVDLPIRGYRSRTKFVANDRPRHENRREFGHEFEVGDGIYIELEHTPKSAVNAACTLLEACDIDPHSVVVTFER